MRALLSSSFVSPFDSSALHRASAANPGLVPYKTTAHEQIVSLAPSAVADRRVRRLKRSVWASGHLHAMAENGYRPAVPWFVTLTYAGADEWKPGHIALAVKRFRNWCRSKRFDCRFTWVAEIQTKRHERTGDAVVHYHLLAWLPVGVSMPHWDRPTTKRGGTRLPFWVHGMTNTERALSGVGYLMKYLSKLGELSRFPKGLRLYGIGGLTKQGRDVRCWFNLPQWAKLCYGVGDLVRRAGGLVERATGEVLPPVWRIARIPSGLALKKLRDPPSRFDSLMVPEGQYPGAYSAYPRVMS